MYMYIYICHENNVPSQLSPQWLCVSWITYDHLNIYIYIYILYIYTYNYLCEIRFDLCKIVYTMLTQTRKYQTMGSGLY